MSLPDLRTDLTCVAFNNFLEHDIELGSRLHKYTVDPQLPRSMSLIALGLPFLHKFMTAPTRTLQQEVIYPVIDHVEWNPRGNARIRFHTIDEALHADLLATEIAPVWADMTEVECMIRNPFFEDPDNGPVSAWSALSRYNVYFVDEDMIEESIALQSLQPLSWGYVFWDLKMLENAGFKNIDAEDRLNVYFNVEIPLGHIEREEYNPLRKYASNQATELLYLSHHAKQLMRKRGETGYFNFEAFCESVQDRLFSKMRRIPEGIMCDLLEATPEELGLPGLLQHVALLMRGPP